MLIVLTSERSLKNEAEQINELFDAGLEILHVRKPTFSIQGYRALLDLIRVQYHNRIMIHQFPQLTNEYALRGIHLKEKARWDLEDALDVTIQIYKNKGFIVSSSFHSIEEIKASNADFEYVFLSPVFSSISKEGYEGKGFDVTQLSKKIIALGGIQIKTIKTAFDLGYQGVGILGAIWQSKTPIESFKEIQKVLNTIEK